LGDFVTVSRGDFTIGAAAGDDPSVEDIGVDSNDSRGDFAIVSRGGVDGIVSVVGSAVAVREDVGSGRLE
jgi:hypothetical protein